MTQGIVSEVTFLGLAALWLGSLIWLGVTTVLAMTHRLRRRDADGDSTGFRRIGSEPAVSVIVAVASPAPDLGAAVRSLCSLNYPEFEILLGAAGGDHAAIEAIRHEARVLPSRIRAFVKVPVRTTNPKVGLQAAILAEARYPLLLFSDDNVVTAPFRIRAHVERMRDGCNLVSAVVVGEGPVGFWASVDGAFMYNFARLQLAGDRVGFAGVTGKSMLVSRNDLAQSGGLLATGATLCEDAALRNQIARMGGRTGLSREAVIQQLGKRGLSDVWNRHKRWFYCRHRQVPLVFLGEVLFSVPIAAASGAVLAPSLGMATWLGASLHAAIALVVEMMFLRSMQWRIGSQFPIAWLIRELWMLPLAVAAILGRNVAWRGRQFTLKAGPRS